MKWKSNNIKNDKQRCNDMTVIIKAGLIDYLKCLEPIFFKYKEVLCHLNVFIYIETNALD